MTETLLENLITYSATGLFVAGVVAYYLVGKERKSRRNLAKLENAKRHGLHEPVSLHPVVDESICIGCGSCVSACPEQDILGLIHGKAKVINASQCVGHGACFHACPVHALTLCIGTEKRGVELPHVSQEFETNIPGMFIAGELGGMALIKNAVEQGKQAVAFFMKRMDRSLKTDCDLLVVGAGPAGISATLAAAKNRLKCVTVEQDTLGGTVFNFPRQKIVLTSPVELPLYGPVKVKQTNKMGLLDIWKEVIVQNKIVINENEKVESIDKADGIFTVVTTKGRYTAKGVILAIGRRGSPRKLGVPGEQKEKVAYRLLEPELIVGKKVLVVGGGDSAIENALMVAESGNANQVTISYRGENFARLKPQNASNIAAAVSARKVRVFFNSNVKEITDDKVLLTVSNQPEPVAIDNDLVYIFAGGTLPTAFLQQIGVKITSKFGEAILKHEN